MIFLNSKGGAPKILKEDSSYEQGPEKHLRNITNLNQSWEYVKSLAQGLRTTLLGFSLFILVIFFSSLLLDIFKMG